MAPLWPRVAGAETAVVPGAEPRSSIEIRLALSEAAARTLFEPRMRRLVQTETESFAVLAPSAIGPLGDHIAEVWVAQPSLAKIVVEVRVADRPVERREIAVRGLAGDVAARLVALAVTDLVRAGAEPRRAPASLPAPKASPSAEETERTYRLAPTVVVGGGIGAAALPGSNALLGGPSLAFSFRRFGLGESLFGRWLEGSSQGSSARWLEVGLGVDYRFWVGRSFRVALGAEGAFSAVHLADAIGVEGVLGDHDAWSARAGGRVGFELRVARPVWLTLDLSPAAVLRPVRFTESAMGPSTSLGGGWLGFSLGALFEYVAIDP